MISPKNILKKNRTGIKNERFFIKFQNLYSRLYLLEGKDTRQCGRLLNKRHELI